ncbi:photosystem I P700 chlorophyll A apoprotein A2, partial [Tanacetum coccineum]
ISIQLIIVGVPQPSVQFHCCYKSTLFRQHVVHKIGVQLHFGHGYLDVPHVIDEFGKPKIEHLHIVPYVLCIGVMIDKGVYIPPGGRLGRGHKGLYDTIKNSIHFQLGLALASLGVITSLVAQHMS